MLFTVPDAVWGIVIIIGLIAAAAFVIEKLGATAAAAGGAVAGAAAGAKAGKAVVGAAVGAVVGAAVRAVAGAAVRAAAEVGKALVLMLTGIMIIKPLIDNILRR